MGTPDGVGDGLRVGEALLQNVSMTVVTSLGVSLVPPDGIGYGPVEGTQHRSDKVVDDENPMGRYYTMKLFCYCRAVFGRIARITAGVTILIWIGTTLLTR